MMLDSVTEYALSFSGEAVHLQSRPKPIAGHDGQRRPAWRHLGSVDFDDPQFRDALSELRQMATGSDEHADLPVTLVIPDDQILYTTLTVAPSADREHAVGRALDGLTPYAIEDLAFDWDGDGDSVRVAAAARQTLREARDFAAQYGFQGVDYCAEPQDEQFPGEPIFVLDAPSRVRPRVDPTAAGVTAAALMIQDEPEQIAPPQAKIGEVPGAEPDAAGLATPQPAAEDFELPADGPVERTAAPETAEAQPKEQPQTDGPDAVAQSPDLAEPLTDSPVAATPAPDETTSAEPVNAEAASAAPEPTETLTAESVLAAAPEAGSASLTQPAAEPGTLPERDAAAAFAAENVPLRKAPPVVRHAPARPDAPGVPVDEPRPEAITPRARAVHDRAAEARQTRSAGAGVGAAPAAPAKPVSNSRGGLAGLVAMLGALIVGLVLIWAFAIPDEQPTQVVAAAESATVAAQTVAPVAASTEPTAGIQSGDAESPAPASPSPVSPVPDQGASAADAQVTGAAAATPSARLPEEPEADDPEAPVGQIRAEAPPISALTQDEQRRVVIAAAAVAAAVVPPNSAPLRDAALEAAPAGTREISGGATRQSAPQAARPLAPQTAPAATLATPSTQATGSAAKPAAVPRPTATPQTATPRTTATPTAGRPVAAATAPASATLRATPRLTSSARPQLSPRRSTPQTSTPREDAAPRLPTNPLPYAARQGQQTSQSGRPPSRGRGTPAQTDATPAAVTTVQPATRGSARPPPRPEGSAPDLVRDDSAALQPADQAQLAALIRDLNRHGLAQTGADPGDGSGAGAQLAQARPQRKPDQGSSTASDAVSSSAVEAALRSAATSPPDKPASNQPSATPARNSGGLLRGSSRPLARPAAGQAAVSERAVESAVASAVNASAALPGGVRLSTLRSSSPPPRRSEDAPAAPAAKADPAPATPEGVGPTVAAAAAAPSPAAAEISARRALDEQLQSQAEARIRARAQADAAAEAQARAQAEARARAQAAAEERAARANRQVYKPPEVDDEPEVASNSARGGTTAANVAKSATQSRGIDMGRTTIIGIIDAGQASRALIRLRNGKIVTVRLGDRIDGGAINSIGNGRLTYVKSGQVRELRMLDGR